MTITVTWDPIPLNEARGFPTYIVTLTPLSPVGNRATRQVNDGGIISVTTTETNIASEELDPDVEYTLIVTVTTDGGEASTDGSQLTIVNPIVDKLNLHDYTVQYCYKILGTSSEFN